MEVMKMVTQEEIGKTLAILTRRIQISLTKQDHSPDEFQMMVMMETMEMTVMDMMILGPKHRRTSLVTQKRTRMDSFNKCQEAWSKTSLPASKTVLFEWRKSQIKTIHSMMV